MIISIETTQKTCDTKGEGGGKRMGDRKGRKKKRGQKGEDKRKGGGVAAGKNPWVKYLPIFELGVLNSSSEVRHRGKILKSPLSLTVLGVLGSTQLLVCDQ
jgi:hypothetical protein